MPFHNCRFLVAIDEIHPHAN